ncbi:hypothetical protein niasHS_016783 [Heterodera schachtii]|uniref:Uncharacterized protein n=1 Tax=Heterodera schachtii TaxID=97005 RepID=A0ABD2HRN0_HETSC
MAEEDRAILDSTKEMGMEAWIQAYRKVRFVCQFIFDTNINRFALKFDSRYVKKVKISSQLSYILGFDKTEFVLGENDAKFMPDMNGGVSSFHVYTPNLIEPMMIGDVTAPVLRIVTIRGKPDEGGKRAQFLSRIDFDLGNQELYLLNNLDLLFTIYKAKDSFLLQTLKLNDTNKYRLAVHDVKIYAKMIEVQPSLNMNLYKTLEKQPATYAVRKTEIKSSYISVGRYEFEYNVFSSTIPRRVTIALVDNSAFNGDYKMSPFKFDPFEIREISVHAGGMVYPVVPYKLDFSKNYFVRPFVDMYEALGMANSERSFDITMSQFKDGWTFFVVPLIQRWMTAVVLNC